MELIKIFQNSRQEWIIFTISPLLYPFDESYSENDS